MHFCTPSQNYTSSTNNNSNKKKKLQFCSYGDFFFFFTLKKKIKTINVVIGFKYHMGTFVWSVKQT